MNITKFTLQNLRRVFSFCVFAMNESFFGTFILVFFSQKPKRHLLTLCFSPRGDRGREFQDWHGYRHEKRGKCWEFDQNFFSKIFTWILTETASTERTFHEVFSTIQMNQWASEFIYGELRKHFVGFRRNIDCIWYFHASCHSEDKRSYILIRRCRALHFGCEIVIRNFTNMSESSVEITQEELDTEFHNAKAFLLKTCTHSNLNV